MAPLEDDSTLSESEQAKKRQQMIDQLTQKFQERENKLTAHMRVSYVSPLGPPASPAASLAGAHKWGRGRSAEGMAREEVGEGEGREGRGRKSAVSGGAPVGPQRKAAEALTDQTRTT